MVQLRLPEMHLVVRGPDMHEMRVVRMLIATPI